MKNTFLALLTAACLNLTSVSAQITKTNQWLNLTIQSSAAWKQMNEWIQSSRNRVELLPVDSTKAKLGMNSSGIDASSYLGTVICQTGGLLVDNGWLRVLGSGSIPLDRGVIDWNKDKCTYRPNSTGYLIVADDVVGGIFGLKFSPDTKLDSAPMYYLGANNLTWTSLGINYPAFIKFCFEGNIDDFYEAFRWNGWQEEIKNISPMQTISCYPLLWTKEGKDLALNRKIISEQNLWKYYSPALGSR